MREKLQYFCSMRKTLLIILLVLNIVVLLGQIWPEGAPPFGRAVNIIFLIGSLVFFVAALRRRT
jgi:hypothetical protein